MSLESIQPRPQNDQEATAHHRNAKPVSEKRTEVFYNVRFTKAELCKIKESIKRTGLMNAEWIWQALMNKAENKL